MNVIFASSNKGKIHELQTLLQNFQLTLMPQSDYAVQDVEETGLTFVENAIIKARHACAVTGLPAIADDSGLEVPVLQGAPGIRSARYAGPTAISQDNIKKLLTELKNTPDHQRTACFQCVLVFMTHANDPTPLICQGTWHGTILKEPQGHHGFGYDPVFYVENEKCSAAELPLDVKNKLSHRGHALRMLMEKLPEKLTQNLPRLRPAACPRDPT
jgi:XTP/dITP diphosphohydrolase